MISVSFSNGPLGTIMPSYLAPGIVSARRLPPRLTSFDVRGAGLLDSFPVLFQLVERRADVQGLQRLRVRGDVAAAVFVNRVDDLDRGLQAVAPDIRQRGHADI